MEVNPIRDVAKISEMKKILRKRQGGRNELLFVMGINTALRIGDLLSLSVGDVVDGNGRIRNLIKIKEQKTGKMKQFPINEAIHKSLSAYMARHPNANREDPLFSSQKGGTLSRWQALRILRSAGKSAGLENIGTHSLRKTFAYHVYRKTGCDIGLVQKLLNHSASEVTLRYIGIDRETMDNTYMELNL
jgi:integrase